MKVSDLSIDLRIAVATFTAFIVVAGSVAYVELPKESNPSIEIPNIVVTTLYPGASPNDVERLITQAIEREVSSLSGIDEIRSTSTEGVSTVVIEFTPDVKMDEAKTNVREKVDLARPDLPDDVEEPIIAEIDISDFPVMNVNLAAPYSLVKLKTVAEDLQDALESIPSVLEVGLVGALEREVQVEVNLNKLQAYNLEFKDLIDKINNENTNIPGGSIDVDHLNYLVRVDGQFASPEEILDLVIKAPGGEPIYVRDIASVKLGFKERKTYARVRVLRERSVDGKITEIGQKDYGQVITLSIKKRAGENILDTADAIRNVLKEFPLPPDTSVNITGDQSEQVNDLVKDLENNIIAGLVFVVTVLVFFLGVRTSLLVGVAIPLSMMVSFLVFALMGQTMNFIILFSLIIALGMLVDNAIVLVENIYRFLEEGHTPFDAAKLGAAEVGMAVFASTATTVAAFIPMLFWPGMIGKFMSYMPLTLIVTLTSSLFVALVINPVLTGYFARAEGAETAPNRPLRIISIIIVAAGLGVLAQANTTVFLVVLGTSLAVWLSYVLVVRRVSAWTVHRAVPWLIDTYRGFLTFTLTRDYTVRWALPRNTFTLGCLALGLILGVVGGATAAAVGFEPARMLLFPAGFLFAVGMLGVVLHTFEVILLGRWYSVRGGLLAGLLVAGVVGLMELGDPKIPGEPVVRPETIAALGLIPALLLVGGLLGAMFIRRRKSLILTDNRAALLNATLGALCCIIVVFAVSPTGVEFFPETDPNQIIVKINGALGTNLESSNKLALAGQDRVDQLLAADPNAERNTKSILATVGIGGADQFGGGGQANARQSQVMLNLSRFENRAEPSSDTLKRLRAQLKGLPGAEIEFVRDQAGPPTGPPVNIEVTGKEFSQIVKISETLKLRLLRMVESGTVPELVDVRDNLNSGRPELAVRIDRERAAQFKLDTRGIASTIRTAVNGTETGTYRDGEDEYDIVVRLDAADRASLESLRNYTIMHEGQQVPLVSVAEFSTGSSLGSVTRKDQQRVVTVMANVTAGSNAQAALEKVQAQLADYRSTLPAGYTLKYTGQSEDQNESFAFLTTALMSGAALITMILIAQFNSVFTPLIIMAAVALSMIGVLLGLIITRTAFGMFTFIGVISLAGIVVNNNIVLIDYTEQLRRRGMAKTQAVIEAGATRLRPVLLTAMTTVLGLIPLTFGINIDFVGYLTAFEPDLRIGSANTQFWGPMGVAIISGLVFATFLTLVIVPTMYSALDSAVLWLRRAFLSPADAPAPKDDAPPVEPEPVG